jgi:hypothetical protein
MSPPQQVQSQSQRLDEEKTALTEKLSDQYSQNIISLDEYERLLEYINRMETAKEADILEKIIRENSVKENNIKTNRELISRSNKHTAVFSWRTSGLTVHNGDGGKFTSVFGANRIIVDKLPPGKTALTVESVFGLTEIVVPPNIKIVTDIETAFAGVFASDEMNREDEDLPELHITGRAVFANITIIRR